MITEQDRVYLGHIFECISLIQDYTANGKDVSEYFKLGLIYKSHQSSIRYIRYVIRC